MNKNGYMYSLPAPDELAKKNPDFVWSKEFFNRFEKFYYSKPSVTADLIKRFYSGYWQENRSKADSVELYKDFLVKQRLVEMTRKIPK